MSLFNDVKTVSFDSKSVIKLELDGQKIWELISYKNWVTYSIEADGTPYNGGLGYKNGYRIRSSGEEAESTYNVCTGFIPYKAGDILEIYSPKSTAFKATSYINVADDAKTNIGQISTNNKYGIFNTSDSSWSTYVTELDNGIRRFIVPTTMADASTIAFVRVSVGFSASNDVTGEGLVITINEEI